MYEKPRYHGRKCVLAEGDVEISNPWAAYRKDGEAPENTPFRIGSLKRVVRDYRLPEISLFSAENGEGTKVRFTGSSEDTRLCAKPLTASSIIVHSGLWLIYSKPFFDDDPYVLEPGGYPSLKAWGAKDPAVCSLHPITLGCPVVEKPGEPKAVIYELAGFQGHSCEVNQDIYDLNSLGPGMPPVGSLRILGGCWVGYEKEGFRGHQYLLEEGEYPDWQQWGGCSAALGSLRLIRTVRLASCGAWDRGQPGRRWGLCEQSNFRGRQWVLDCMEITNWLLYSGLQHVGSLYPIRQTDPLPDRKRGAAAPALRPGGRGGHESRARGGLGPGAAEQPGLVLRGGAHQKPGEGGPRRPTFLSFQRRIHFRIANVGLQLLLCVPEAVEDMRAGRVEVSALAQQSSPVWYYEEGLIKNQAAPTMSLQVIGQAGKGAKVVLWAESRVPRQAWRIDSFGRIWSQMFEGMILDVKGGRSYDRDHAVLWDVAEERPLQIWDIQVL
nr:beta/gamma crystallin domain-containing protein 2 [Pelodiscus sinensis]|eukprot:XP_025038315.1 beta/gamma crystallin domain-containing protein 2 [Pelodiscus sinensis]